MKDRRMRLLAAVTVLCAAVAVIAGTAGALPQALPQPAAAPVPAACYTLREYEGGIAVFFGSADLPALRFDIPVYTLPAPSRRWSLSMTRQPARSRPQRAVSRPTRSASFWPI